MLLAVGRTDMNVPTFVLLGPMFCPSLADYPQAYTQATPAYRGHRNHCNSLMLLFNKYIEKH